MVMNRETREWVLAFLGAFVIVALVGFFSFKLAYAITHYFLGVIK
jgi:hypothetical protein